MQDDHFDFKTDKDAAASPHDKWSPLKSLDWSDVRTGDATDPGLTSDAAVDAGGHGHDDWCDLLSMGGAAVEDEVASGYTATDDLWL